jgi:hypothetical protein
MKYKPESTYKKTEYFYSQEQAIKALGFKIEPYKYISLHCDGINKVRIEVLEEIK